VLLYTAMVNARQLRSLLRSALALPPSLACGGALARDDWMVRLRLIGERTSHACNRNGGFHSMRGTPERCNATSTARELRTKNHEQPAVTSLAASCFGVLLAMPQ
jgi:hypothetical protein